MTPFDPELTTPVPRVPKAGRPEAVETRRCPVEQRTCPRHGVTDFARYGKTRPRWKCKRCVGEAVTRRLQKVKSTLVEEAGGCCAVCGYNRTVVNLHFHHVDPRAKSFAISVATGKSLGAYREETRKCVLVCANCHGEIEAGLIESPPAGATYADLHEEEPRRAA